MIGSLHHQAETQAASNQQLAKLIEKVRQVHLKSLQLG